MFDGIKDTAVSKVRTVHLPPYKSFSGWDISRYNYRWDLIESKLA